jgi:hypothetical protein
MNMTIPTISTSCPSCGGSDYKKVGSSHLLFSGDRVCDNCGTRFAPPKSLGEALLFILGGSLMLGVGATVCVGLATYDALYNTDLLRDPLIPLLGPLMVAGGLFAIHGVRCLKYRPSGSGEKPSPPPRAE